VTVNISRNIMQKSVLLSLTWYTGWFKRKGNFEK